MSILKLHSRDFYKITIVLYHLHRVEILLKRTFGFNNTWDGFHLDLGKRKVILQNDEYPPKLIDKLVYRYLGKKMINKPSETDPIKTNENIRYFKLPFIGKFSKFTENKLQKLTKQFCKEGTNIKIVFSTFKLASLFSTKDKFLYGLKSHVFISFSVLAVTPVMWVKSTNTFLPGLMNI